MTRETRSKLAAACLLAVAAPGLAGGCVSSQGASLASSGRAAGPDGYLVPCRYTTRYDPSRPLPVKEAPVPRPDPHPPPSADPPRPLRAPALDPVAGFRDPIRLTRGEDVVAPPDPDLIRADGSEGPPGREPGVIVAAPPDGPEEPGEPEAAPVPRTRPAGRRATITGGDVEAGRDDRPAPAVPAHAADDPGFPDGVRISQAPDPRRGGSDEADGMDEDQEDTDLGRSRAGRRGEGGGPTRAEEDDEEENEEDEFKSDLLQKTLGLEDSPVGVFGWLQGSFTGNPARPRSGLNFGVDPNQYANTFLFQQLYFVVEKRLERKRSDEYQLGFRFDSLSGSDWNQFNMVGLFDQAFRSRFFGYDPVQFYGEVHLPWLTEGGVDVKGGRFYSLPGYEDAAAPGRPLNSATYLFNFGQPFTHFGMMTTFHVTDRLNLYNGAVNGWDRWIDQNYRWGYAGGLVYDTPDEKTNVTITLNVGPNQFPRFFAADYQNAPSGVTPPPFLAGRRNPLYNRNNAVLFTEVVIHEVTDKLSLVLEADQGYESNILGFTADGTPTNAQWYGLGYFCLYEFNERWTGVYRGDVFRDRHGVRTGFDDTYFEQTLGLIYKPWTWLWFRPEVRGDWASGVPVYNDEKSNRQLTLGFDTIFLF